MNRMETMMRRECSGGDDQKKIEQNNTIF